MASLLGQLSSKITEMVAAVLYLKNKIELKNIKKKKNTPRPTPAIDVVGAL
jgi:hypothetical protein